MSRRLPREVRRALLPSGTGKTVYVTVGNVLRGDDGVAPFIAGRLNAHRENIVVIDAGDRPEAVIHRVARERPSKTVIIDAADFHGEVGDVRFFPHQRIPGHPWSTHQFPLKWVAALLEQDTGSPVCFIGIQIQDATLGVSMNRSVRESAEKIIEYLRGCVDDEPPGGL
jgi:hydrogenase maturation protease HycI